MALDSWEIIFITEGKISSRAQFFREATITETREEEFLNFKPVTLTL